MPDPGNQEQDPKFKPDPKKGWYTPPSESSRKLNEGDEQPHQDQAPAIDQETLFRAAAIKCAQMEEELAQLMKNKLNGKDYVKIEKDVYLNKLMKATTLASYIENIKGVEGGQLNGIASISFLDGLANDAEKLGIKTNRELMVGLHADEKTCKQFNEFAKKDPTIASNASTMYYFTQDGEYKKSSRIPVGVTVDSSRPTLYPKGGIVNVYESEMTAGDFEIAGQALQMLINRLKPQEKAAE